MKHFFICVFSITIAALFSSYAQDRHVSVFYYPWYDTDRHWPEGYLRNELETVQPPLLGEYSVRNPQIIAQHISWSETYGIDNWICSWWGPGSFSDEIMKDYISGQLDTTDVSYCLFYESAGLLNLDNGIDFDTAKTETFRSHFNYMAENFFSDPSYYKIAGRPVVYIYLTRTFKGDYQNAIRLVRQDMLALGWDIFLVGDEVYWGTPNAARIASLDAITAYNMHGPHQYAGYPAQNGFIADVDIKFKQYKQVAESKGVIFIPDVMPGFNDRGVRLSVGHYIIPTRVHKDSSHTSTFSQSIDMAIPLIDNSLNSICITSFNEWHEDTQIEPTIITDPVNVDMDGKTIMTDGYFYQGYGTDYLDLIRKKLSPGYPLGITGESGIGVSIFPNPADEYLYVRREEQFPCRIEIFSAIGQLVYSLDTDDSFVSVSLGDIPAGIYLIKISDDRYETNMKFVKR